MKSKGKFQFRVKWGAGFEQVEPTLNDALSVLRMLLKDGDNTVTITKEPRTQTF